MTREAVDVLPLVIDAIGATKVILVGHSDGASIAAIYAGSFNDPRLAGIALMAPHFFTEDMGLAEIAQAKMVLKPRTCRKKWPNIIAILSTRLKAGMTAGCTLISRRGISPM